MPGPDWILVATDSQGDVKLPWQSRDAFLDEIRLLEGTQGIVDAFDAADETTPARLTNEQKGEVFRLIDHMTTMLGNGYRDVQEGIWNMRNAFEADLARAGDN
jgi:hypothetical protein